MIRAIETRWKGYRFRSRLEARWAVFFDALGLRWEYEPEGYDLGTAGWYLPDFWLPDFNGGLFVEIKPEGYRPSDGELARWAALVEGIRRPLLWTRGTPGPTVHILISGVYNEEYDERIRYRQLGVEGATFCTRYLPGNGRGKPHRLYILYDEEGDAAAQCGAPIDAINAARSARFEHGESPHG